MAQPSTSPPSHAYNTWTYLDTPPCCSSFGLFSSSAIRFMRTPHATNTVSWLPESSIAIIASSTAIIKLMLYKKSSEICWSISSWYSIFDLWCWHFVDINIVITIYCLCGLTGIDLQLLAVSVLQLLQSGILSLQPSECVPDTFT